MAQKKSWEHLESDVYGAARSRCPACKGFATEGKEHKCPRGRNRNPFVNPVTDPDKQGNPRD